MGAWANKGHLYCTLEVHVLWQYYYYTGALGDAEVQGRHSTTLSEERKKNNSVSSLLKDILSLIW